MSRQKGSRAKRWLTLGCLLDTLAMIFKKDEDEAKNALPKKHKRPPKRLGKHGCGKRAKHIPQHGHAA